ncbi:ComEA family DNA-binding protein [Agaribacter marinus]|uniref:Helix-hairpin-helix DNA-binding motif class 1 domain-containing protein n=1 Tax=Agaribacter marinus TaxID=1431249 RepID=A0AA37SW87_9ALTE|nr:helix-hairpin-helix domain-containing protein [Agaribacter marinus]GLR70851.1 hypothetical protein GCM10007852_17590 [Agaribacter marinus]
MKLTTWITLLIFASSALIFSQAVAFEKNESGIIERVQFIDINKADADTLMSLPGIGRKKAEAIVAYRELNGAFTSKEELVNVKGIGKKMMQKVSDKIRI